MRKRGVLVGLTGPGRNVIKIRPPLVIDESQLDNSKVLVHSTVKIKNQANGMEMTYKLVAQSEADLKSGKISVDSPIGKGLLGKEVGDVAEINVPNGVVKFEVIDINRE